MVLMEVDAVNSNQLIEIINYLISNNSVCFKNQSREESDLTDPEKFEIARDVFEKSKSNFLARFGKHLKQEFLEFFKTCSDHPEEILEINTLISNLSRFFSENDHKLKTKNRRYEALKKLIEGNAYFSENEMMKRNPLLYEQLVGQYLSESEKKERDMYIEKDTLVKILLEGIERDLTEEILKKQLDEENLEEDRNEIKHVQDDDDEDENEDNDINKSFKWGEFPHSEPSTSKWGEIKHKKEKTKFNKRSIITKKKNVLSQKDYITAAERKLLKEEFTSIMHQNFLNGKDDFDYSTIDNNDEYDNIEILDHDEEEKYFDSEEPDDVQMDEKKVEINESSEDELDIYMNALNQHPSVINLSKDLEKNVIN
ncbi:coiled-coil domain-containing protein 97 [Onthophagus taurus]|uniref:coiled-coil domain-containing protein 97 n=1 Tax=Onthophagus taurus TaxID=166361 RepID=UPI000C20C9ED|nr:coiled-coil domain-containing protein 97 [Onthophagus taurus]